MKKNLIVRLLIFALIAVTAATLNKLEKKQLVQNFDRKLLATGLEAFQGVGQEPATNEIKSRGPETGAIFYQTETGNQSWKISPSGAAAVFTGDEPNRITEQLRVSGFNFDLPANAVIKGIEVGVKRYGENDPRDHMVSLVNQNTLIGQNRARFKNPWPAKQEDETYGSAADLWNIEKELTPEDINSKNFGVALVAAAPDGRKTNAIVNSVFMTVYYLIDSSKVIERKEIAEVGPEPSGSKPVKEEPPRPIIPTITLPALLAEVDGEPNTLTACGSFVADAQQFLPPEISSLPVTAKSLGLRGVKNLPRDITAFKIAYSPIVAKACNDKQYDRALFLSGSLQEKYNLEPITLSTIDIQPASKKETIAGENWLWHLTAPTAVSQGLNAVKAWKDAKRVYRPLIAFIDSGVRFLYPVFDSKNFWIKERELSNGRDDDGNGLVDDIKGWNFFGQGEPIDDYGHGTLMASLADGRVEKEKGLAGIDSSAFIMPLKACGSTAITPTNPRDPAKIVTMCNDFNVMNAVLYAAANGADIINMSMNAPLSSLAESLQKALKEAVEFADKRGSLVVAAANNHSVDTCSYAPTNFNQVLVVAANNASGQLAEFNKASNRIDVLAPGDPVSGHFPPLNPRLIGPQQIVVDPPPCEKINELSDCQLSPQRGASVSTALVSGAASLMKAVNPKHTPYSLRQGLMTTASNRLNWNPSTGFGVVNVAEAIKYSPSVPEVALTEKLTERCESATVVYGEEFPVTGYIKIPPIFSKDEKEINKIINSPIFWQIDYRPLSGDSKSWIKIIEGTKYVNASSVLAKLNTKQLKINETYAIRLTTKEPPTVAIGFVKILKK